MLQHHHFQTICVSISHQRGRSEQVAAPSRSLPIGNRPKAPSAGPHWFGRREWWPSHHRTKSSVALSCTLWGMQRRHCYSCLNLHLSGCQKCWDHCAFHTGNSRQANRFTRFKWYLQSSTLQSPKVPFEAAPIHTEYEDWWWASSPHRSKAHGCWAVEQPRVRGFSVFTIPPCLINLLSVWTPPWHLLPLCSFCSLLRCQCILCSTNGMAIAQPIKYINPVWPEGIFASNMENATAFFFFFF